MSGDKLLWAALAALVSCGSPLVNLTKLVVTPWPNTPGQVLAAADTVRLTFSEPVDHPSTQGLLNVTSADGTASGDRSWVGNTLTWTPVPPLSPGKRYSLEFAGRVQGTDGRVFSATLVVPFFSGSAALPGRLESSEPADGATSSVSQPLVLTFSEAMDPVAFEAGFTLSPATATSKTWAPGRQTVTITPTTGWAAATLHTWRLSAAVKTQAGVPLIPIDRNFVASLDQEPPRVLDVVPGVWNEATSAWFPAGTDLNQLRAADALVLTTSEPIRVATLSTALRLTPSVRGHIAAQDETLAPCQYVFAFDETLAAGTSFTLQIGTDLKDRAGNALTAPWLASFTPAIPALRVEEVQLTGTTTTVYTAASLNRSNFFPVCEPLGVIGSLQIMVRVAFSQAFTPLERTQFADLAFCQPLFPTSGLSAPATPTLVTVDASLPDAVVLTYRGFSTGRAGSPVFYQVKIPGGPSGLTASGLTLKEDAWINFATGS